MANLPDSERAGVWSDLMQRLSRAGESVAITKPQLRAAVDAADTWVDENSAAFNSALPAAARNNLTAKQKAMLLAFVILKRYEVS